MLRCGIGRSADLRRAESECLGNFGERRGDPQRGAGVDSEVVVAATQILHDDMAGDHDLRCSELAVPYSAPQTASASADSSEL